MVKVAPSKQENQRQLILQLWRQGTCKVAKIHSITNILLKTIYWNLKKIGETGDVKHKGFSDRVKKITPHGSRAIGQYVRRNPAISAQSIATKLEDVGINVSRRTVSRHLRDLRYQNVLPIGIPMLTSVHKKN